MPKVLKRHHVSRIIQTERYGWTETTTTSIKIELVNWKIHKIHKIYGSEEDEEKKTRKRMPKRY